MAEENPYRGILFGHTHVPYVREVGRDDGGATLFVNVGSGGRPKDGDWRVCYALVDPSRLAVGEPAVEFVRVPYAVERTAEAIRASGLPAEFAEFLLTGGGAPAPSPAGRSPGR